MYPTASLLLLLPLWTHLLPSTGAVAAVDYDGHGFAAAAALAWESRTGYDPIAAGRHHPITFANETHGFLLTGSTATLTATSDFLLYDEADDSWTDLTDISPFPGEPRSFGYGVVLNEPGNTKAYVGFGASDRALFADLWEFDMSSHGWKRLADFPGPGRRHPAMNAVLVGDLWKIHVGLGDGIVDGQFSNMDDWWSYDVASGEWTQLPDFPSSRRHHPFHFALGGEGGGSYAGLGHSDGFDPYIERDWYRFDPSDSSSGGAWHREGDFASYDVDPFSGGSLVTTEARVAGTQFAVDFSPYSGGGAAANLTGALGFVLSGDGDDHRTMETGEFHAFYTASAPSSSSSSSSSSPSSWWRRLPPHPGPSRWAPGSFVMRGTARAYFTSGLDRSSGTSYADLWTIDLSPLFLPPDADAGDYGAEGTTTANATATKNETIDEGVDYPTIEEERTPNDEGQEGSDGATFATSAEATSNPDATAASSRDGSGAAAWGPGSGAWESILGAAVALWLSFRALAH